VIISHVFLPPLPPFSQSLTRWTTFWILQFYRQSHDRAQRIIVWFPFISIAHLPNLCSKSQPRWSYNDKSGGSPLVRTESAHIPRENVGGIWFQYGLLENGTAGYGCECVFFGWASFLAVCPGGSRVRDGIMYYQKTSLKNMVWYCISYLHLFFQPFACLLTWNTGPRLMVDSDVKSFICFVARRNSMRLMIGCFIPFQVHVHVGVNLDAAHAQRMKVWISTISSILFFSEHRNRQLFSSSPQLLARLTQIPP